VRCLRTDERHRPTNLHPNTAGAVKPADVCAMGEVLLPGAVAGDADRGMMRGTVPRGPASSNSRAATGETEAMRMLPPRTVAMRWTAANVRLPAQSTKPTCDGSSSIRPVAASANTTRRGCRTRVAAGSVSPRAVITRRSSPVLQRNSSMGCLTLSAAERRSLRLPDAAVGRPVRTAMDPAHNGSRRRGPERLRHR